MEILALITTIKTLKNNCMDNQLSVEEGNKLIAEFMGMEEVMSTAKWKQYGLYHSSWDWLMPVIEKIEYLNTEFIERVWVSINGRDCGMWTYFDVSEILRSKGETGNYKTKHTAETKIKAVWLAVVEFITWLNQQPK